MANGLTWNAYVERAQRSQVAPAAATSTASPGDANPTVDVRTTTSGGPISPAAIAVALVVIAALAYHGGTP